MRLVKQLPRRYLMMKKRKAFGISKDLNDGISQTILTAENNAGQLRYEVIPLKKIKFDPENPRQLALKPTELLSEILPSDPLQEQKKKELESLRSLANSIMKTGVRHAIEVFKDGTEYRLISGERRVLGSLLAGKLDIQARIVDARPSEYDIRYLQWIENIEREDLSTWERLQNVKQLIFAYHQHEDREITATLLKDLLGCSLPQAMTYLSILQAPPDLLSYIQNNKLTNLEKISFLAKVEEKDLRAHLLATCIENNLPLARLKAIYQDAKKNAKLAKMPIRATKGRTARRVTLGYTDQINVVKKLIELVLTQTPYPSLHSVIKDIDWNDCSAVSKAFQRLIKSMESSQL